MASDNPGMPSGGDNAAVSMAREIETSVKQGNYDSASQKFAQEIQRYSGQQKQVFVKGVLQQLQSKGYHLTEIEIVGKNALGQTGAPAARPRTEAPRQPGQPTAANTRAAEATQRPAPSYAGKAYEAPLRGSVPPQTVQTNELPPLPKAGQQAQHLEHTGSKVENPVQAADRIAQGAQQIKSKDGINAAAAYIKEQVNEVYNKHTGFKQWAVSGPGSFGYELNKKLTEENIWGHEPVKHGAESQRGMHKTSEHGGERSERGEHERYAGRSERTRHSYVHANQPITDQPGQPDSPELKLHERATKVAVAKQWMQGHKEITLRDLAKINLPENQRTRANINERLKELEHINHLKPNSYFRAGDQVWLLTTAPSKEQPTPQLHAKPAAKEQPASRSKLVVPAIQIQTRDRETVPWEEAQSLQREKTTANDLALARSSKDHSKEVMKLKSQPVKLSAGLKVLHEMVTLADLNIGDGQGTKMGQVWTRANLIHTLVSLGGPKNINEAKDLVRGIDSIDPTYRQEYKSFQNFVQKKLGMGLPSSAESELPQK